MSKRTNTCQIDHSGDPEPRTAEAAPRPVAVTASLLDVHRRAGGQGARQAETRLTDWVEIMRRIRAAVGCEVPTDRRGDARSDCAQDLALKLWREAREETGGKSDFPRRERVRMVYLRLEARSWARAQRRTHEDSTSDVPDIGTADLAGRAGDAPVTDWGAHRAVHGARALCAILDLSTGGPVETALVTFLREGASGAEIADGLGMSHDAYRVAVGRGRTLIAAAYPDPRALLRALLLLDSATGDPSATRRAREAMREYRRQSWRDTQALPCEVSSRRAGKRDGWRAAPVTAARRTASARRAAESADLKSASDARRAATLLAPVETA